MAQPPRHRTIRSQRPPFPPGDTSWRSCPSQLPLSPTTLVRAKDSRSPYSPPASSHTSSSVSLSSVGSELDCEESFYERIVALTDIIPPSTRQSISSKFSSTAGALKTTGKVDNLVWIVATSVLLIGLPLALMLEDQAEIVQQEKEMLAQQQAQPRQLQNPPKSPF